MDAEDIRSHMSENEFISVDLEDFSIYRPHATVLRQKSKVSGGILSEKLRSNELVSLYELNSRASDTFFLDGIIHFGASRQHHRYVQKVAFESLSIGAYEDVRIHTIGPDVWLQSTGGKGWNVWYRLRRPAPEYLRYHTPFLWLADLAKHVVDYLHAHLQVTLRDFRTAFSLWLETAHGCDHGFRLWRNQYPKKDFRLIVAAYAGFIYNQAGQIGRKVSDQSVSSEPGAPSSGTALDQLVLHTSKEGAIRTGDIVAIPSDTNTTWKTKDMYWYAYVQGRKTTALAVALFAAPRDTDDAAEFYVRQTYSSADSHWSTLQTSHFRCRCRCDDDEPATHAYSVGDTLLVKAASSKETLEPVVLLEHAVDGDRTIALVRRLLRKKDDYGDLGTDSNELVYSSRCDTCEVSSIVRRCHVRFYTLRNRQEEQIPAPYNRNGAGDFYYVILGENESGDLKAISELQPPVMNQGFDPAAPTAIQEPMRGLDIFCGGGNLGRGLEEGRAVKMEWAVDYFNEAIHTYHANSETPSKLYNGSVNDYLFDAIHGRRPGVVAQKGEVVFIGAGSPCQGFSSANRLYANDSSLLNISLVASVVAFVDFYRPKYLVMENVLGMAYCGGGGKGVRQSNVFAQVLCALVGLGYQVRPMLLDSWNFGSAQGRSRLFITATAPGLATIDRPPASHSHPESVVGRSLGKTANGLPFGAREWLPTPFEYVTIGEATSDLPYNPDGRTACISCPDHRVTKAFSALDSVRMSCVPRFPPGMTFVRAAKLGWQPPPQMAAWHWDTKLRADIKSKAWQRAKSNALLPTVTTENAPNDALTGSALHWDAHRQLSVMEARRAQGYPDDEVIIGTPAMQWKIVGNSVTRQVAIALGLSVREAWLANAATNTEWQTQTSLEAEERTGDRNVLGASENVHGANRAPGTQTLLHVRIDSQKEHSIKQELRPVKRIQIDLSEDALATTPTCTTPKTLTSTATHQSTGTGSSDPIGISSRESSLFTVKDKNP
ncbi:MAG: hypothetical protein Q9207_000281 [Kuettlingeria erythrocarpa]